MSHIKTVEYRMGGGALCYSIEIDAEDPDNLVIENVTLIEGKKEDLEKDIDPDNFADSLDIDDWKAIRELLEREDSK